MTAVTVTASRGARLTRIALLVGAVTSGLAGAGSVGAAWADTATRQVQVADTSDAWYSSPPALNCSSVIGCPPVPVPQSGAPGTLQVGEFEGSETARAYVALGLAALPAGTIPVDGTLILPISDATDSGNLNPATAQPEVCLAAATFPDGTAGSTSKPPAVDCSVHMATTYRPSSSTGPAAFTADLAPALAAWSNGHPDFGLAVLPAPGQPSTSEWDVAFNGRSTTGVPRVSAAITVVPGAAVPVARSAPSPTGPAPAAAGTGPAPAAVPAAGAVTADGAMPVAGTGRPSNAAAPPGVAATPDTQAGPLNAPVGAAGSPYQTAASLGPRQLPVPWPILWFPLLLLAGGALTLRAFLNPVIPESRDQ